MRDMRMAAELLDWYDLHARNLPWRVSPLDRRGGIKPDPYSVWLSEIMLQQTTVVAVKDYYVRFKLLWPTIHDLARAEDDAVMGEWAGLGYYARARNLLKCAREIVARYDGRFPESREMLQELPGIGPYTAAAISAIAFDKPSVVVDGNVERVMARVFDIRTPLPAAKPLISNHAEQLTPKQRAGDYAQAVMDLGATICTPRSPACGICPWMAPCVARDKGIQAQLPAKKPKKPKPTRQGTVYVALRSDGAWLVERRPESGLLGGMPGWPSTEWNENPAPAPPIDANWRMLETKARHTFTHFHLQLSIAVARVPQDASAAIGEFVPRSAFRPTRLPTVMRKVFDLARGELQTSPD